MGSFHAFKNLKSVDRERGVLRVGEHLVAKNDVN
jgi:hypothetical protein